MTHIMLDLETWGKTPGCDIRSIGAVVFDPVAPGGWSVSDHTLMNGETFYIATDNPVSESDKYASAESIAIWDQNPDSSTRPYKLTRDPETVEWWNKQSEEARTAFTNPVDLREACERFAEWFNSLATATCWSHDIRIWANDPHFDISILDAVYHAVQLPTPWHYRAPRSFRTITEAAGMTREEYCNYGDAHNALHDAIAQAMTVCEAYKRLGLQRQPYEPGSLDESKGLLP